jgi:hypothetical protein
MIGDGIFWDSLLCFISENNAYYYNLCFELYVFILRSVGELLTCYERCLHMMLLLVLLCVSPRFPYVL